MSVPMRCPNGHVFADSSNFKIENASNGYFLGLRVRCPACDQMASSIDGVYSFKAGELTHSRTVSPKDQALVDAFFRAVKAPGVTRDKVEALKAVAEATKAGALDATEAAKAAEAIAPSFGELWTWLNANSGAIGAIAGIASLLVAIIALWLTIETGHSSDASSAQAHVDQMLTYQDAQAARTLQQKQLEVEQLQLQEQRRDREVQEKLYALLAAQRPNEVKQAKSQQTKPRQQTPPPQQSPGKNRHERRKAAALDSKKL